MGKRARRRLRGLTGAMLGLSMLIPGTLVTPPSPAAAVATSPAATSPEEWGCDGSELNLDEASLSLAPVSAQEREQDGSPIRPRPAEDGSWVPVVLVHGWTAGSTHPNADGTDATTGTFSYLIDLWSRPGPGQQPVPRSLVGQLQGVPGAAVFTYDYHPYSSRWVTDDKIGPGLARAIDCLQRESGRDVVVIGHSMGGLALRQALTVPGTAEKVAAGITVGTPHSGSVVAGVVARWLGLSDGTEVQSGETNVIEMVLTMCGSLADVDMDYEFGTFCDGLPSAVRAFHGEAGRALRAGSDEITDLPAMPDGVPFYALAGRSNVDVPGYGWFAIPGPRRTFDLGDVVVSADSALPNDAISEEISCAYRLTTQLGAYDEVRLWMGLLGPDERTQSPRRFAGACFHNGLPRSVELTNDVVGIASEHIGEQTAPPTYEVPEYCEQPARRVQVGYTEDAGKSTTMDAPVDWPERGISITGMFCSAGNSAWPGMVMAHDSTGNLLGEPVYLRELEPQARSGSFTTGEIRFDEGRAVVPYSWQSSAAPPATGEAILEWDADAGQLILVSSGTDRIDWLSRDYLTPWSPEGQPETFVEGCSVGPQFPGCTSRIMAAAPDPGNSSQAAVLFYGYDSEGWPVASHLGMYVGGAGGAARDVSFPGSAPAVVGPVGCDIEMHWEDQETLRLTAVDCQEAGPVAVLSWTSGAFEIVN